LEDLGRAPLRLGRLLPLTGSSGEPFAHPLDGEGLVMEGENIWIVSEGRRTADRPAALLRFDRRSGRLRERIELPPEWRAAPGQGLDSNRGPESLALLPPAQLLLAAERPLLQDTPGSVRLLRYGPLAAPMAAGPAGREPPGFTPLGSLALPLKGPEWGLTELLPLPEGAGLLGLVRGFEAPGRWWATLQLLPPLPPSTAAGSAAPAPPLRPLHGWDLLAEGIAPDNWEGLAVGPPLSDGRPTLLLVSDDNFSPLQANRLARIAPRRQPSCR
jgi:hypothetical protein